MEQSVWMVMGDPARQEPHCCAMTESVSSGHQVAAGLYQSAEGPPEVPVGLGRGRS